ncbi:MAG: glycosyltransferase family 4 protein [Luteibaculaceae bacterium]
MPTVIALNIRFIKPDKMDGIGLYSYHIAKRLVEKMPEVQFHLISDGSPIPELTAFKNVQWVKLFPPCRHTLLFAQWLKSLTGYIERNQPDLYIGFGGSIPHKGNYKTKLISVIHDLNFIVQPGWAPGKWGNVHQKNTLESVERAHHLVTVSNFSKQELVNLFSVEPNRIDVIYNASRFKRQPRKEQHPLILWVGSVSARKNVENMLAGYMIFRNKHPDAPDLLLSGRFYQGGKKVLEPYNDAIDKGHIRIAGRLTDDELSAVFHQSVFLIYPSLYEGFGLPLVEAMACGLPITCSDIEPFKEVCGDAALYFNPNSPEHIADAFTTMWLNEDLRTKLSIEGLKQQTKFSWHNSALQFEALIHKILGDA